MKKYTIKVKKCDSKIPSCILAILEWLKNNNINYQYNTCRHDSNMGDPNDNWIPELARGCIIEHYCFEIDKDRSTEFERNWLLHMECSIE